MVPVLTLPFNYVSVADDRLHSTAHCRAQGPPTVDSTRSEPSQPSLVRMNPLGSACRLLNLVKGALEKST